MREVLVAEHDLRRRGGDSSSREEYLNRFPEYGALVLGSDGFDVRSGVAASRFGASEDPDSASSAEPRPSSRLGRFEIEGVLGRGSFGTVYRARDLELDRLVALKVPHASCVNPDQLHRFVREARSAAQLRHPGIVTVLDARTIDGRHFLASELIPGRTLAVRCTATPSMAPAGGSRKRAALPGKPSVRSRQPAGPSGPIVSPARSDRVRTGERPRYTNSGRASTQARLEELAEKANEGRLSDVEQIDYDRLRQAFHFITILQAKARALLDRPDCA